jgi:hypothetical protein
MGKEITHDSQEPVVVPFVFPQHRDVGTYLFHLATDPIGIGGGDDDHARIRLLVEDVLKDLETVAVVAIRVVQHRIYHGQVELSLSQSVQGLGTVGGNPDRVARIGQGLMHGVLPKHEIFYNERAG